MLKTTIRMALEKFIMLIWYLDMKRWIKTKRRKFDRSIKSNYEKLTRKLKQIGRIDKSKMKKLNNHQALQNKKKLQNIPN